MPTPASMPSDAIGPGGNAAGLINLSDSESFVRRGPIRWLVLCGISLIAAIALGTAIAVGSFRQRALEAHQHELENTVLLLSRHFDQQLEDFNRVQKDIVAQIQQSGISAPDIFKGEMSTLEAHEMLRAKLSASSDAASVMIFAADGALINSSASWPVIDLNIADRRYFTVDFQSHADSVPDHIELVKSRLSGKWAIIFSRKIVGPKGNFLGLLSRAIESEKFEEFFRSTVTAPGASMGLFHSDGTMLARFPHVDAMMGQNFTDSPVHQQILSRSDHGTIQLVSPVDGLGRLASTRRLTKFPISILATISIDAALADWREQTRLLVVAAGLTVLVIVAMLSLIVRQFLRQHRAARQQLDTALNNMTQGLILYDAATRIVLFNRRYIDMYGLSLEVVKTGLLFRDVMRHRKRLGSFEGDPEKFCDAVLANVAAKKLTYTIVESRGRSIQVVNQPLLRWRMGYDP